jgi:hypothetical protein
MKEKTDLELEIEIGTAVKRVIEDFQKKHKLDPAGKPPGVPPQWNLPDGVSLMKEISMIQFGLRCMMSLGGYKFKPLIMSDVAIKQRSDQELTRVVNNHLMLKAAELVILRAGLRTEYIKQIETLQKQLQEAAKPNIVKEGGPAMAELMKTLSGQAAKDGGNHDGKREDVPSPGGESDAGVGKAGL